MNFEAVKAWLKRETSRQIQSEPGWLDLETTLPQLASIKGVLRPKMPPPGLSLSDDLSNAIRTGGPAP
jgi:hypothetical protein